MISVAFPLRGLVRADKFKDRFFFIFFFTGASQAFTHIFSLIMCDKHLKREGQGSDSVIQGVSSSTHIHRGWCHEGIWSCAASCLFRGTYGFELI